MFDITFRPRINGPGKAVLVVVDPARTALIIVMSSGFTMMEKKDKRSAEAIWRYDLVTNMNVRHRPDCSVSGGKECSKDEEQKATHDGIATSLSS